MYGRLAIYKCFKIRSPDSSINVNKYVFEFSTQNTFTALLKMNILIFDNFLDYGDIVTFPCTMEFQPDVLFRLYKVLYR